MAIDRLEVHDAIDATWHHGAARTVTVNATLNSATITYASGTLTAADVRRPISAFTAASAPIFRGGTFIRAVAATSATLSQTAAVTQSAAHATIEHTNSRVLVDANCTTAAASNLTSPTATFTATDVNKSVSGGPFGAGSKITAVVNATTATVAPHAITACTDGNVSVAGVQDTITIGAATYSGTTPVWSADPFTRALSNSAAGQAFSCTSGGHTLTSTTAGGDSGR